MDINLIAAVCSTDLKCRCCNQGGLYAFVQQLPQGDSVYVHCTRPGCTLHTATRNLADWLTMDLTQWGATQHPAWEMPSMLAYLLEKI